MKDSHRSPVASHQYNHNPKSPINNLLVYLFLSAISGILLAIPFLNGKLWIFAWFGFIPLFFAIRNKTPFKSFLFGYLAGIIFWAGTIHWLINVTLLGQILLILYLSLYFGILGLSISFTTHHSPLTTYLFLPSLWAILEYLRSHLLTGFGWALLGYSQYLNFPIIQIADLFGVYGVSFLIMMVNVAVYSVFSCPCLAGSPHGEAVGRQEFSVVRKRYFLTILLLSAVAGYGYYHLHNTQYTIHNTPVKISVIQGNIPQELKWVSGKEPFILDRYAKLTKTSVLESPDLIIWPEAAAPGLLGEDERIFKDIFALVREVNIPLLVGSAVKEDGKYFNSGLLINNQGVIVSRYDKLHLVPFGEYIPLKNTFRFLETIVPIGDFNAGREYTIFSLPVANNRSPITFAVLICFEDTIPELARNFVKSGAAFLINITNDGWFGRTAAASQHLAASVFRAVENRVSVVRSANTGISCFIDSCGRIKTRVLEDGKDIFVQGFKTETIMLSKEDSLYRHIGDGFVLACLAVVAFCGIISVKRISDKRKR